MQKREKKWFIIDSAVGPIYLEPNFHSSCLSEAVYGESCEILDKQDNWLDIKCEDGYRGWINSFYGYISNEKNKPSYIVAYPSKSGCFSSKYPFGSMVEAPVKGSILISKKLGSNHILKIAENLLGIPAATELKNLLTHYPIPENVVKGFKKENEFQNLDRMTSDQRFH